MANFGIDDTWAPQPAGHWYFYQASWSGTRIDGCISGAPLPLRTVAEVAFVDRRSGFEGTVNHRAWYLIASVDKDTAIFNFDRVRGAAYSGDPLNEQAPCPDPKGCVCSPRDIPIRLVPGVTIKERTENNPGVACTDNTVITDVWATNPTDPTFTVNLFLDDPTPDYYTEVGRHDPRTPLIDGFEILQWRGTVLGDAPTSSEICAGWSRVAAVPYGTCGPIPLVLDIDNGGNPPVNYLYWFATRLIYTDCQNGARLSDPAYAGSCARPGCGGTLPTSDLVVGSPVSSHCGPVRGQR